MPRDKLYVCAAVIVFMIDPPTLRDGVAPVFRAIVMNMSLTMILALIAVPGPSLAAPDEGPRDTAVVTARAQVLSGVRIPQEHWGTDGDAGSRTARLPKPRERPCPEADDRPCRLFVIDMP